MSRNQPWSRLRVVVVCLMCGCFSADVHPLSDRHAAARAVPSQLSDEQFWKLSSSLSEQDGTFRSDNLLSNELNFQYVIPELLATAKQGRVYMGVGPEQNFTYIAALKQSMAFIIDISYGNFDVRLMYKVFFILSAA